DRRSLGTDPEWICRVLDVHALVDLPVPGTNRRADQVVRVRRVGALGNRSRSREQIVAHEKNWNTARVTSAPRTPPQATSTVECTPAATRVWATRNAISSTIEEIKKRCCAPTT